MVDQSDRLSPLATLVEPGLYGNDRGEPGVELSERLCASLVQVQAWPDTLEALERAVSQETGLTPDPNLSVELGERVVMPSGPGRYLIEDESDDLEKRLRMRIPSSVGAVTGLSHGRVVVSINGPKAEWVLASGIALDFALPAFPIGAVRLSHHHEIGVTIRRTGEQAFDLYVFTSFARGFWHWISRASEEVGYSVS